MGQRYLKRFYNAHKTSSVTHYTLSFDVDFKNDVEALPWLVNQLNKYKLPAVFAVVGKYVEEFPDQHLAIVSCEQINYHEVINHTYSHPWNDETNPRTRWDKLSIFEKEKEIKDCQEICKKFLGREPIGFRIPHFGAQFSEDIYPILQNLKFKYDSSRIATHINNPNPYPAYGGIWEFPMSSCLLHPFDLFDTWHSLNRGPGHHKEPGQFYKMFLDLVNMAEKNGVYVNFYIDPQDVYKNEDFIKVLEYLSLKKDRVVTYEQIFKKS
jgi:peptidoglycan/xylan/chitin deacetylase (PgdA/CDA1 family)